jgi:hypothetical protein
MKPMLKLLVLLAATALCVSTSQAQSLGDAARANRKNKRQTPKRVITNDDIRRASAVSDDSSTDSQPAADTDAPADSAPSDADAIKAKQDEWKARFAEQKTAIAGLTKEIDILQRENRLRAASYYADAGSRLRDEKKFAEEDRRFKDEIEAKQGELATAKQRLEEMQDEARREGMPSSVAD